jgi:hypothetical protein
LFPPALHVLIQFMELQMQLGAWVHAEQGLVLVLVALESEGIP